MKNLVTVNTNFPTIENQIEYLSGESLLDYEIVVFNPGFPHLYREEFSSGGSCISIESSENLKAAMSHWSNELLGALKAGKTIFFLMNEQEIDSAASGATVKNKSRTFHTYSVNNYSVLPLNLEIRNAKGKQIINEHKNYNGLYEAIKDIANYKVIFSSNIGTKIFAAKDGSIVATEIQLKDIPGKLILLPYFTFDSMVRYDEESKDEFWTDKALQTSHAVASQLVALDKIFRHEEDLTPTPEWIDLLERPSKVADIDKEIITIDSEISKFQKQKELAEDLRNELLSYTHLLYESGNNLETAIEKALRLLDYEVENYRNDALEIDHVITSPEGKRMIGESEGKDNSAINITKFRQLETNINEDFARDEIETPAKGILFGNGFRFTKPDDREEQFTKKCLTNAQRLGTALVRTADLYSVALYVLNNPKDYEFKKACRDAIEGTSGSIVEFPSPTSGKKIKRKVEVK